jgi:hypothetical protein
MAKQGKKFTIAQSGAVTSIHMDVPSGWEQWYLHVSDCHYDSVFCNRDVMKEQFDEAVKRRARINIYGDFFDAMQGRFDPRRSMAELRPEYRREDYYDFVVDDAAEWLKPYAPYIDILSDGNHELSVVKAANINLMDRLVKELRRNKNCTAVHGGYGGWLRYMLNMSDGESTGPRTSVKMRYYHGAGMGGDAPVTKGVINTNRQAVYLPDANVVINGHNHNAYYVPIERERISNKGIQYFDTQHHIRIPGYKQAYADGTAGWDVVRGSPPKPIGAFWIRMYMTSPNNGVMLQVIPDMRDPVPVTLSGTDVYTGNVYNDDGDSE